MRILVDADACPVVSIVEKTAKKYEIPVVLLCDTNHVLYSDYSEVITVELVPMQWTLNWSVCVRREILL